MILFESIKKYGKQKLCEQRVGCREMRKGNQEMLNALITIKRAPNEQGGIRMNQGNTTNEEKRNNIRLHMTTVNKYSVQDKQKTKAFWSSNSKPWRSGRSEKGNKIPHEKSNLNGVNFYEKKKNKIHHISLCTLTRWRTEHMCVRLSIYQFRVKYQFGHCRLFDLDKHIEHNAVDPLPLPFELQWPGSSTRNLIQR